MAIKHLSNISLEGNELQNAVIHPLGTAPGSPVEGQIYYDSGTNKKTVYVRQLLTFATSKIEMAIKWNKLNDK